MVAITQRTGSQASIEVDEEANTYEDAGGPQEFEQPDVVVTGFGPFRSITINPSFQIAQALPTRLKSSGGFSILVKCHPEAVHVGWDAVLGLIPDLYHANCTSPSSAQTTDSPSQPSNDVSNMPFFIHIGAGGYGHYHIEQLAHRDGYWSQDVDNKSPPTRKKCNGQGYPCEGDKDPLSPRTLETSIDVHGVVDDVRKEISKLSMPVEVSTNAGNYLCDFIFYTSLREARLRYGKVGLNKVLFVHVPPDGNIEEGVKVLSAIIRSIVRRDSTRSNRA